MSQSQTPKRQRRDPARGGATNQDPWVTCPACGKRSYSSRKAADRAGTRIPGPTRAYRCGNSWHLTSESARKIAFWRDVEAGLLPGVVTRADLKDLDPRVYDLRAAGWSMFSIALELNVSENVVARILRQHDPLAVPGRRIAN